MHTIPFNISISHFLFIFFLFTIKDHDCESGIGSTRRKGEKKRRKVEMSKWINMRRKKACIRREKINKYGIMISCKIPFLVRL
jgi:hypothetical protein